MEIVQRRRRNRDKKKKDNTKKALLMSCGGRGWFKSHPLSIFIIEDNYGIILNLVFISCWTNPAAMPMPYPPISPTFCPTKIEIFTRSVRHCPVIIIKLVLLVLLLSVVALTRRPIHIHLDIKTISHCFRQVR